MILATNIYNQSKNIKLDSLIKPFFINLKVWTIGLFLISFTFNVLLFDLLAYILN